MTVVSHSVVICLQLHSSTFLWFIHVRQYQSISNVLEFIIPRALPEKDLLATFVLRILRPLLSFNKVPSA